MTDTIFALSSGALPAAIAIVRLSGPCANEAATRLAGTLPPPRVASVRQLRGADGSIIDEALLLRFPAPRTATGEDLVEFHLHGGRAVVARLLWELGTLPHLREAEPGEFTRRALINGRLDLTQAEGLGDLLSAETEWQRRAAIENAGGAVSRKVEEWRDRLVALSAKAEAAIDYVGDEDETAIDVASIAKETQALSAEWRDWIARPSAETLQNGLRIVLAGPPNSGKSSLFNALVGSDRAIVTDVAGTTRDTIEARVDFGGIPTVVIDTAGLRQTTDEVERIGIARAEAAGDSADILLWLGAPDDAPAGAILVHSRADARGAAPNGSIAVTVRENGGVDELLEELKRRATQLLPPGDAATLNRRQRALLLEGADGLVVHHGDDLLILAEALRQARSALDRITGRQSTDDVLDALFSTFCLGK